MSEHNLREILRPMRALRHIKAPAARARLAIYRVQEQLGADVAGIASPRFSLRRAVIPAAVAAAILLVATALYLRHVQTLASRSLAASPLDAPQSIQQNERQQLQQAVASSNGYRGWVDVRVSDQVVDEQGNSPAPVMLTELRVNPSQSQPSAISMLIPLTWDAKAIPIPLTWEGTSTRFSTPDVSIKRQRDGWLDVFSVSSRGMNMAWPTSAPATPQAEQMLIYVDPNTNLVKQVQAKFRQQDQLRMTTVDYDYRPSTAPAIRGK